jgi:hypothetical protein
VAGIYTVTLNFFWYPPPFSIGQYLQCLFIDIIKRLSYICL